MFRWKALVPRLFIAMLIALMLWIARDSILRRVTVNLAQTATGAKVDVGNIQSNWETGELKIQGLQITDPNQPMRNLFQADRAELWISGKELWRRRVVIEKGRLHNVQFDTPRTQSGQMQPESTVGDNRIRWNPEPFQCELKRIGSQFLENIGGGVIDSNGHDSNLRRAASDIRSRWPRQIDSLRKSAQQLNGQLSEINRRIRDRSGNPLRQPERREMVASQLPQIEQSLSEIHQALQKVKVDFTQDLRRLEAAKERDIQGLEMLDRPHALNQALLSNILVGPQLESMVDETIDWIKWFRQTVPDPARDFHPIPPEGVNVQYASHPQSGFQIRNLEFDGCSTINGRHCCLYGKVENFALAAGELDPPTTFELRTQGQEHILIGAEMDRRNGRQIDVIRISSPQRQQAGQRLGDPDVIELNASPGSLIAETVVRLDGDQVDGRINLSQSNTAIAVSRLHPVAGGERMAELLTEELAGHRSFHAEIHLFGALDDIQVTVESDLGSAVVEAFASATEHRMRRDQHQRRGQVEAIYAEEIEQLVVEFSKQLAGVERVIGEHQASLQHLQTLAEKGLADDIILR